MRPCLALFAAAPALLVAACSMRLGPSDGSDPSGSSSDGGVNPLTKVDGGGAILPPPPGAVCFRSTPEVKLPTAGGTDTFAFVWDTDYYVFVYADPSTGNGDIYTLLVNPDGSTGAPIPVELTDAASDLPSIVPADNGFLVVWEEGSAGKSVYVHAIDKSGNPTGDGVSLAATQAADARPVLTTAPGGYVAAWMDQTVGAPTVSMGFVDSTLKMTTPTQVNAAQATGAGWPWLAGSSSGVGMIWSSQSAGAYNTQFATVNTSPLGAQNPEALRSGQPNNALLGRMIATSTGYLAAWEDGRDPNENQIYTAILDPTGKVLGGGLVEQAQSGDSNWPNMAWTGSAAAVVYYQWRDGNPQIYLTVLDGTGARLENSPDTQISDSPAGAEARYPDVIWTGSELGVAWIDTRDGAPQLYFAQVGCKLP